MQLIDIQITTLAFLRFLIRTRTASLNGTIRVLTGLSKAYLVKV